MKKKQGRPRKRKETAKGELMQVRLETPEKQGFNDAARLAGQELSVWVRDRLRRIAREELEGAGLAVPFLPSASADRGLTAVKE